MTTDILPEEAFRFLLDLLARIHRDGGHYTQEHGIEKSCTDADMIVANLYASEVPADRVRIPTSLSEANLMITLAQMYVSDHVTKDK